MIVSQQLHLQNERVNTLKYRCYILTCHTLIDYLDALRATKSDNYDN